jgi:hypothetical protein
MILGFSTIFHLLQDHCHKNVSKFKYWKDIPFKLNFYEFSVRDYSEIINSRNRLFLVENLRYEDDTILLKQASKIDFQSITTIKKEAKFYEFTVAIPNLKYYLSSYFGFDEENYILYRKWNNKAEPLSKIFEIFRKKYDSNKPINDFLELTKNEGLDIILRKVGTAINTFHKELKIINDKTKEIKPYFSATYPSFIFSFDEENVNYHSSFGGIKHKIFSQYLKTNKDVQEKIVLFIKSWNIDSIVHNDFKSSNILIQNDSLKPTIIDWEYASLGDSNWDIACVLADLVGEFYMPYQHDGSLNRIFILFNYFLVKPIQADKIIGFAGIKLLDVAVNENLFKKSNHLVELAGLFIKNPTQFSLYISK